MRALRVDGLMSLGGTDDDGALELSEPEAWGLGGHSAFPMLDPRSELAAKLYTFWESIV